MRYIRLLAHVYEFKFLPLSLKLILITQNVIFKFYILVLTPKWILDQFLVKKKRKSNVLFSSIPIFVKTSRIMIKFWEWLWSKMTKILQI